MKNYSQAKEICNLLCIMCRIYHCNSTGGKKAFEFKWFNCMPGLTHQPKNLTIAQIIPDQGKHAIDGKEGTTRRIHWQSNG